LMGSNSVAQSEYAVCCYVSTTKGATWSSANYIVQNTSLDQTFGAIDPVSGRVYAIWNAGPANGTGQLGFAYSDDGVTWNSSTTSSGTPFVTPMTGFAFVNMSVAPDDGSVHIIGLGTVNGGTPDSTNAIFYARSLDRGQTLEFGAIASNQSLGDLGGLFGDGEAGVANLAVENPPTIFAAGGGILLAAWNVNTATPSSTTFIPPVTAIALASCGDNGAAWLTNTTATAPQTVPLLPLGGLSDLPYAQFFSPRFAMMPNGTMGCLCVVVEPNGGTATIPANLSFAFIASPIESGQYFTAGSTTSIVVSGPTTSPIPANNPVLRGGDDVAYFIGDFVGLAATALGFFPYWSDPRNGSAQLFSCNVRVLAAIDVALGPVWMTNDDPVFAGTFSFSGIGPLIAADVDGDGEVEIVAANSQTLVTTVLKWQKGHLAPVWVSASPVSGPAGNWNRSGIDVMIAADVDGDGEVEVVVANNSDLWTGVLKWQSGALVVVWMSASPLSGSAGNWNRGSDVIVAADVDGDGADEVFMANGADNWAGVLKWQGGALEPVWMAANVAPSPFGGSSVIAADVDGDGADELVVTNNSAGSTGILKWQQGELTLIWWTASPLTGPTGDWIRATDVFLAADVDGDGQVEVVVANNSDGWTGLLKWQQEVGALVVIWMSASPVTGTAGDWNRGADVFTVADVDGDGADEVVISDNSDKWTGVLKWFIGPTPGLFNVWMSGSPLVGPAGSWYRGPDTFVAADVDGDGADEVFVSNAVDQWIGVLGTGAG
jgi:FG-GAP-like repeat